MLLPVDWGEFVLVQAVIAGLICFGAAALHGGGWIHSSIVAAIDRSPIGHLVLTWMALTNLRNQDTLDAAGEEKLPSLYPALTRARRYLSLVLGLVCILIAAFFELMYLVELA